MPTDYGKQAPARRGSQGRRARDEGASSLTCELVFPHEKAWSSHDGWLVFGKFQINFREASVPKERLARDEGTSQASSCFQL